MLLSAPLFALTLYQRSSVRHRVAEEEAATDSLTGLKNRREFERESLEALVNAQRGDGDFVLCLIDIDHFKQVNDNHGHDAGDRALVFIARALQAAVRPGDLVGRFGGEEFCVLMAHADNAAAHAFDVRMRAYMTEAAANELGFALAYSAGIAIRKSADDTLAAMLERADRALYGAKDQGRSRTLDARALRLHVA